MRVRLRIHKKPFGCIHDDWTRVAPRYFAVRYRLLIDHLWLGPGDDFLKAGIIPKRVPVP